MKDPVLIDEARYDRDMELAQEAADALLDQEIDRVTDELLEGDLDSYLTDIIDFCDPGDIMQIVLDVLYEREPKRSLAWRDTRAGLEEWIKDMAKENLS